MTEIHYGSFITQLHVSEGIELAFATNGYINEAPAIMLSMWGSDVNSLLDIPQSGDSEQLSLFDINSYVDDSQEIVQILTATIENDGGLIAARSSMLINPEFVMGAGIKFVKGDDFLVRQLGFSMIHIATKMMTVQEISKTENSFDKRSGTLPSTIEKYLRGLLY